MRISDKHLRKIIQEELHFSRALACARLISFQGLDHLNEAIDDWDPEMLPKKLDTAFGVLVRLREDPELEGFVGRGRPMMVAFNALQRIGRAVDTIIGADNGDELVDIAWQEALSAAKEAHGTAVQMLIDVGGSHPELESLVVQLSEIRESLDLSEYHDDVPAADLGDLDLPM